MVKFSKVDKTNLCGDLVSCGICKDNYQESDNVTVLKCQRLVHTKCLLSWEKSSPNINCLYCRRRHFKLLSKDDLLAVDYIEVVKDPKDGSVEDYTPIPQKFARDLFDAGFDLSEQQCLEIALLISKKLSRAVIFDSFIVDSVGKAFEVELINYLIAQHITDKEKQTKIWIRTLQSFENVRLWAEKEIDKECSLALRVQSAVLLLLSMSVIGFSLSSLYSHLSLISKKFVVANAFLNYCEI